jgi:hypothetical protein
MKFIAFTLLLATFVAANPGPAADPAPAAVAQPEPIQAEAAVVGRAADPEPVPEINAPLLSRDPKKGKGGGGGGDDESSGGNGTEDAAGMLTPSRALQLGAVGLGIMEIVRLWG